MYELLFLGVNDKVPTCCQVTKCGNTVNLIFTDTLSKEKVLLPLHENEYEVLRKETINKFLNNTFMEDVKSQKEFYSVLADIQDKVGNPSKTGSNYLQCVTDVDMEKISKKEAKEYRNALFPEQSGLNKVREEYSKDMQKLYRKVLEAEDVDLSTTVDFIFDQVIEFMRTLTDNDKNSFYADLRSKIDSEFYGKISISKDEYENLKKYEKIVKDIKEAI